jgi:Gpi18-like mannosyltransferase
LFSLPNLSEDVYRFIWDGRLTASGMHSFSQTPAEILANHRLPGLTEELFTKLNSKNYYTVYPPVLQVIFWCIAKILPYDIPGSVVMLKSIVIIAECGIIYLLIKILKKLDLSPHLSLLYILNPLVITELTGNAHVESVMIFFVLLAFAYYLHNRYLFSALFLSLGIATKLIPVLFLPLLVYQLGWKKGLLYAFVTCLTTLMLFFIFFDAGTEVHLLKSMDLFIRKFEFNASIYYLVRWIGTIIKGYNIISIAGPVLLSLASLLIILISFNKNNKAGRPTIINSLFIITAWYLFSTTVHPWYLSPPIALCVFTPYRYAIAWSFVSLLSYAAYQFAPVKENLLITGLGYVCMLGFALYEFKKRPNNDLQKR